MAYEKQTWVDGVTPINAEHLNHMEEGIGNCVQTGELDAAVQSALKQAKESGEFDGAAGKTAYAYAQEGGYTGSEAEFAAKLANEYNLNPLYGKKVSFLGDSICAGSSDGTSYLGGYGKIIADRNNMVYENVARGGATVTAETYSSTTGSAKPWLCRMVESMSSDADYAIIEGGINDAWQMTDHNNLTVGEITVGYDAVLDDTTYCGAFESMLKQLVTRFKGKKVGYIAVPKLHELYDSNRNAPNFYHIALECCAKWGVPVCDLNTIIPSHRYIAEISESYTGDGTHPTEEGYRAYYCDPIEAWMRTLTTGGSVSAGTAEIKAHNEDESAHADIRKLISALQSGKLSNEGISFRKAHLPLADGTILEIDVLTAVDGTVVIPFVNRVPISIDTDGSIFNGVGYKEGLRLSSSGVVKEQEGSCVTGYIPAKGGDVVRIYGCGFHTTAHSNNYICAYDSDFNYIGGLATTQGAAELVIYDTDIENRYTYDADGNMTITLEELANIAYIRVNSRGLTASVMLPYNPADMIVTINEEIE